MGGWVYSVTYTLTLHPNAAGVRPRVLERSLFPCALSYPHARRHVHVGTCPVEGPKVTLRHPGTGKASDAGYYVSPSLRVLIGAAKKGPQCQLLTI